MGFRFARVFKYILQAMHLCLGFGMVILGLVEFSVEPPLFDILGPDGSRPALPEHVFVSRDASLTSTVLLTLYIKLPVRLSSYITV